MHTDLELLLVLNLDAEQDRLEVRRETNEQDKHLDVISDALTDLQRIGEVSVLSNTWFQQHSV